MASHDTAWSPQLLDAFLAAGCPVEWAFTRLGAIFDSNKYGRAVAANNIPQWIFDAECEAASLEMSMVAAGGSIYDEFLKASPTDRDIRAAVHAADCCIVLLDGLSLREIPEILRLAGSTPGCTVQRVTWALSAAPSDTVSFRQQRLGMGTPNITQLAAPMQQLGVTYRTHRNQTDILQSVSPTDSKVFVWSQFPDSTFGNDSAKKCGHFTTAIVPGLRQVWNNVIMKLGTRRLVITSDHGYILQDRSADGSLGPELWEVCPDWTPAPSDQRLFKQRFNQIFGASRFVERHLTADELTALPDPRIVKMFDRGGQPYTTVVGRFFWHGGGSVFEHYGLSLLECILPWIELELT